MASQEPGLGAARRSVVVVVIVLVILAVAAVAVIYPRSTSSGTSSRISSTSQTYSTESQPVTGHGYLNVSAVYADLGYPKVTYSDYFPYTPSKPNFTMEYQTKDVNFQIGFVENASVIGLDHAVELALLRLNLTVPLQLAYATFYPGTIVNNTLTIDPMWYLFFAQVRDGFWTYGSYGNGAFSVEADVDALSGKAPPGSGGVSVLALAGSEGFQLGVNSSTALSTVRAEGSSISGVPPALTRNGTVTFMEPRIALLGPNSNNAAFENPLNASLSGQDRLCWVIQLSTPSPNYGYQGTFAVDAVTGKLVSGFAENLFPNTHLETVTGSPDFSTARNLTVSEETFQISGSIIQRSGTVSVMVPNVLVLKPGSASMIGLRFSSTFLDRSMNLSIQSFSNPLLGFQNLSANGLPPGVSARFLTPTVSLPVNGSSIGTVSFSAVQGASAATYLLKLNTAWSSPSGGQTAVIFLLSIWHGTGTWPPPPAVG